MAEEKLRFRPGYGNRMYDVLLGEQFIGTVQYVERRYNLRRVLVSRGWRATLPNGQVLARQADTLRAIGETRRVAAEALRLQWLGRPTGEIEQLVGGRV